MTLSAHTQHASENMCKHRAAAELLGLQEVDQCNKRNLQIDLIYTTLQHNYTGFLQDFPIFVLSLQMETSEDKGSLRLTLSAVFLIEL